MENLVETADESFLRWRVSIEEGEENIELEEFGSEQLLKSVVRTSYLYHLRQSLRKNLEASKQKDNYAVEEAIVNKVIKGCSALLEERALRHCMIARLYQRVMAQTIKDVKKATSECNLYTPLKEFATHQSKIPPSNLLHKEVQTEINSILFANQIADLYSQTEALLQKIAPPNISFETSGTTSSIQSTNSDRLALLQEQNINGAPLQHATHTKAINGLFMKSEPQDHDTIESLADDFNITDTKPILNKRKKCDDEHTSSDEDTTNSSSNPHTTKSKLSISSLPTNDSSSVLSGKNSAFEVKLRSPVFAESVALWYNLECEIEELPPAKKQKLEEKFVQLFGIDHAIDYYFLTDEQKSIACRKRIAKFVVMELTAFYVKKRIASKQLFKTLAKHITSVLLGRSLYPSPEEVKRSVEEFFLDDRIINSEDDFYF